jgi:hypothetical protein
MNILDVQNKLKNFSEEQLVQEMQAPTGNAPQFLVLSEIQRRKRMRDDLQQQQAQPVKTVAEEAIAAGGVPQGGIGQLAGAMGQGSSNAQMPQQQAPEQQPQGMYGGGIVKLAPGGAVGRDWKPSRMSIVDVGNGKVNIVDENGGVIHGPLPSLFAQGLVNDMNAQIDADNEATGAAQQPATERRDPTGERPSPFELLAENINKLPAFNKNSVSRMPNYGPPGSERQDDRSLAERFGFGVLKDTPIAKTFAEFGNFPLIFDLEPKATEPRDPTGESTNPLQGISGIIGQAPAFQGEKSLNMSGSDWKGVGNLPEIVKSVLGLGEKATERRDPSGERPSPLLGMSEILAGVPALMPNYGPPESKRQDDRSLADNWEGVPNIPPIVKSIFGLETKDTERRDPSGESTNPASSETTPDGGVQNSIPLPTIQSPPVPLLAVALVPCHPMKLS